MHQFVTLAKVFTARSVTELVIPSETAHTVLDSVQRSVLQQRFVTKIMSVAWKLPFLSCIPATQCTILP